MSRSATSARPSKPALPLLAAGLRHALAAVTALCLWLSLCATAWAEGGEMPVLRLDGRGDVAVWPAVSLHIDASRQLGVEQMLAEPQRFSRPTGTPGNLGRMADAVWLRVPLHVPGSTPERRVLEFDYPALNRIDVHLVQNSRIVASHVLGNALPVASRPMPSRNHAVALSLPAGDSQLLVRVVTSSSMVLPITLRTPESFTSHESQAHLIQGMVLGLGLCMLIYSLSHWVSLRDRIFVDYGVMLIGNLVFMTTNFGLGGRYLWPETPQLSMSLAPLAVLLAVAAGTRFMRHALGMDRSHPRTARVSRWLSHIALVGLALGITGVIGYGVVQSMATALGLLAITLQLPVAYSQSRQGDRAAAYMLVGWAFYVCGALNLVLILRGWMEPTFWSQYLYALSTMLEMSAWMAVLGLHVQTVQRTADRALVESETLRALAHTDALTGLPNRRGLQDRLDLAMRTAHPQALLAVYLLDLDGFKPVNDRYGHDVGDALLLEVGRRLQGELRSADVVARLGGDEFVVLAAGLADEAAAHAVGLKMLQAFKAPFDVAGQICKVGLTIGYALAPLDGTDTSELLKRADAAMYTGKNAGRNRVERGGRRSAATA